MGADLFGERRRKPCAGIADEERHVAVRARRRPEGERRIDAADSLGQLQLELKVLEALEDIGLAEAFAEALRVGDPVGHRLSVPR